MAAHQPVLIAGGGIGGLTTAIALGRQSVDSTVLERSTFTEEEGAGIQLGPNATRILRALGVLEPLMAQAFRPEAIWIFDGLSGRRLCAMPLGDSAEQRYGAPYLTFHRADLHAGLRAAAEAQGVSVSTGFDVAGLDTGENVTITNTDGTSRQGAALIGADGLWSTVREWVAPKTSLAFTGATAFRSLVPLYNAPPAFAAPIVGLWLGPGAHLVHYPVRSGKALNIVAVTETGGQAEGWNKTVDRAALLSRFTRWCTDSKSLLERTEDWRAWSLLSLPPLPRWSRGAVTLLGDAAHPVLPYLAQGAGLAIEDADCLAQCVTAGTSDLAAAFHAYEGARRARATRLQQAAQRMAWVYHARRPLRLARNFALRRRGPDAVLRQFDWLYGTA
jgi:2-polyprenyl-6-methoxyphenol hydroxylase-like FAD-dependent oxidoreductase